MKHRTNKLTQFKQLILSIINIRFYSKKQVDKLLTKQREICCEEMDNWCRVNKIKEFGHIVLYAPIP